VSFFHVKFTAYQIRVGVIMRCNILLIYNELLFDEIDLDVENTS
jgi:hypothetical protein